MVSVPCGTAAYTFWSEKKKSLNLEDGAILEAKHFLDLLRKLVAPTCPWLASLPHIGQRFCRQFHGTSKVHRSGGGRQNTDVSGWGGVGGCWGMSSYSRNIANDKASQFFVIVQSLKVSVFFRESQPPKKDWSLQHPVWVWFSTESIESLACAKFKERKEPTGSLWTTPMLAYKFG